ncbi:heterodisulfide reductase subunit C [Ectothiorhodosinus mongolicus]|uniref:Heterodisulfide reductase subunit C n=1 Tax=Ectothiorhodosinus mongolicus TaxID=233100 RepID=A0A1R3VR41_9GAMM|nr:4Fe-4S dicluster domain-containing protein [Ectothiorhodosinus mongolicus]ULX56612.1 heterodisulfide reductase subunit C [Ectothiorhodosinus mongolicus]SIT66502.1 heterodisulfide reductase subunit C [Ectothiorhodosinus mongolicus]
MAIHEKSLIEPERLLESEQLVVDGVDVSGHWNTMITPRTITDYDDGFEKMLQQYPGAENVHRCWQCGSCTNSCTMYAQNVQFNPRYWIYAVRLGLKEELIKDKDIIWQCVSCNKCTNICPKDVRPEGVMKALAHWMEEEGITEKTPSTIFDEEFTDLIYKRGRIEDGHVLMAFYKRTGQPLFQEWLKVFVVRLMKYLPVHLGMRMARNQVMKPKTSSWGKTGDVLKQYVREQKEAAHG